MVDRATETIDGYVCDHCQTVEEGREGWELRARGQHGQLGQHPDRRGPSRQLPRTASHFQFHVSGTLRIQLADGTQFDARPGDVTSLPAGHDVWVVGEDPVVVDWYGASEYAR